MDLPLYVNTANSTIKAGLRTVFGQFDSKTPRGFTSKSIKDKFNNVISYQDWAPRQNGLRIFAYDPTIDYQDG